ncbi:hypothetical protein NT239_11000 [Chitinibacter sp. SCUT-21]
MAISDLFPALGLLLIFALLALGLVIHYGKKSPNCGVNIGCQQPNS